MKLMTIINFGDSLLNMWFCTDFRIMLALSWSYSNICAEEHCFKVIEITLSLKKIF